MNQYPILLELLYGKINNFTYSKVLIAYNALIIIGFVSAYP